MLEGFFLSRIINPYSSSLAAFSIVVRDKFLKLVCIFVDRLTDVVRKGLFGHVSGEVTVQTFHKSVCRGATGYHIQWKPCLETFLRSNVDDKLLIVRINWWHKFFPG